MKPVTGLALLLTAGLVVGCASKRPAAPAAPPPAPVAEAPPPPAAQAPAAPPVASAPIGSLQDQFAAAVGADRVFFEVDSAQLTAEAQAVLRRQADWLAAHPEVSVLLTGNCDERGTREYNLGLGAKRAQAVFEHLTSRGVAASRLRTISYGKERPLDPGTDEGAWSRNRNAQTLIQG